MFRLIYKFLCYLHLDTDEEFMGETVAVFIGIVVVLTGCVLMIFV
jgi:heme/copper-type cytochrome/quinol oxidase subunit 4